MARTTETRDFSQGWRFHFGDVQGAERADFADCQWSEIRLPHSWNEADIVTTEGGPHAGGVGWYRKRFGGRPGSKEETVLIGFDMGFPVADVWVNEHHAGQFSGGPTGFGANVSALLKSGQNVIAVRVDNSQGGGLYREATLFVKQKLFIPLHGVTVTTASVSASAAKVAAQVAVRNEGDSACECACVVFVEDAKQRSVTEGYAVKHMGAHEDALFTLDLPEIRRPALWSPESPYLHTLHVSLTEKDVVRDEVTVTFGIRRDAAH